MEDENVYEIEEENENKNINEENKINEHDDEYVRKRIIKVIILILLIIIVVITSFKSGERFFEIKNANFDDSYSTVESSIAHWYFNAEIRLSK